MRIVETESIILKSQSLAEADKIVLALTEAEGMVRLTVRGAKRLKNKFGGRLELFTIADLVYSQKEENELGRLDSAETVESYFYLSRKLAVLAVFSYFSEVLAQMIPLHEPNPKLYRMVRATAAAVGRTGDDAAALPLLVSYFEIWLLRLTGFLPDFKSCANCGNRINSPVVFYSALDNRLVCAECGEQKDAGKIFDSELYKLLRAAFALPPHEFVARAGSFAVPRESVKALTNRLLAKVLDYQPEYWTKEFEYAEQSNQTNGSSGLPVDLFDPIRVLNGGGE